MRPEVGTDAIVHRNEIVDNQTSPVVWGSCRLPRPRRSSSCSASGRSAAAAPRVLGRLASSCATSTPTGLAAAVAGAQALFLWDFFSTAVADVWAHCDRLEWIHVAAAGVDTLLFDGLRDSDVTVTNARGVFDRPIAEFVLAAVLAHAKLLHESRDLQRRQGVAAPRDPHRRRRARPDRRHRGHRPGDGQVAARRRHGGPRRGSHRACRRPRLR